MARKFTSAFLDHAQLLVSQGATLKEVGVRLGCNPDNLGEKLRARGVDTQAAAAAKRKNRPEGAHDQEIIALYTQGVSVLRLAQQFGLNRGTINRVLKHARLAIRTSREANLIRMGAMSDSDRKALTAAANDAFRRAPHAVIRKGQLTRAARVEAGQSQINQGVGEPEVLAALTPLGARPQVSVGPYNVDVGLGTVAVEVKFGCGGGHRSREGEKIKYLLERGWRVVYVVFMSRQALRDGLDYIVPLVDMLQRKPPAPGQYWVIRCGFQQSPVGRNNGCQTALPEVPPELTVTLREVHVR